MTALGLLDTEAEDRFDRLTQLAALTLRTPIALITLVDGDRQWFKSRVGLKATETPRDIAFCAHAIVAAGEGPFVVPDALADLRFVGNPMVLGDPHIRFYAGQTLRDRNGLPVGTLCVLDRLPHQLDHAGRQALIHIAKLVEDEFGRRSEQGLAAALAESERNKSMILDNVTQGLLLQDRTGAVLQWNPAAAELLGLNAADFSEPDVIDSRWQAIRADGTAWPVELRPWRMALRTGVAVMGETMGLQHDDGRIQWLKVNARAVLDDQMQASLVVTTFVDVTTEVAQALHRSELETALRRSEHSARVSLDALEQGVLLVGRDGTIHRMNPAAEHILGYTVTELADRWRSPQWETFDQNGSPLPFDQRPVRRAATTGEPVIGQIIGWRHASGQRLTIRVSCIPDADADSLVVAFTDITNEHLARRLLDATFRAAPVGLAIVDTDRSILRCNPTFAEQAGRPAEDLIGLDVIDLLQTDHREEASAVGRQLRVGERSESELDQQVLRPDGAELWVNTHLAVIPDPQRPLAIAATFDVTERRHMVLELSRFSYLFHHANDLIAVIDAAGRLLYTSPSAQRILGYPVDLHQGKGILGLIHPDDLESAMAELTALIANTRGVEPLTVRVRTFTDEIRHLECVGVNLLDEPAVGGIVVTARDVTERVHLTEQLAHLAMHDTLTDLPNRQLLESTLHRALARTRRDQTMVGLCFIDLDGFKAVNDTYGHATGDRLIASLANRIKQSIRDSDLAARVGGDEFVVVLDQVAGPAQALAAATRLRDTLTQNRLDEPGPRCGASIGLAISRPDDTVSSLLNRADAAMYRAKAHHNSAVELVLDDGFVTATVA